VTRLLQPKYLGGHLVMLVAVGLAVGLGLWQLHAWDVRREAAARDLVDAAPKDLTRVMGGDSAFPGRELGQPVRFSGRWLDHGTVYVSDRVRGGREGYWVVSPLLVNGSRSAMLVVRGWSPTPSAPAPEGRADVTGFLQFGEGSGLVDDNPDDDVLPELRIGSLVQRIDTDLYSGYVIARHPGTGLAAVSPTDVPEPSQFTALRNLLYALQWWVFGLFALVVWFRWCRDQLVTDPPVPSSA
jgi:cytochrome oxidase assembly protein ShyY1